MYPKKVKIVLDKLEILTTNKYADTQLSTFGQNEIQRLIKKDNFKVVTPDKLFIPEEV